MMLTKRAPTYHDLETTTESRTPEATDDRQLRGLLPVDIRGGGRHLAADRTPLPSAGTKAAVQRQRALDHGTHRRVSRLEHGNRVAQPLQRVPGALSPPALAVAVQSAATQPDGRLQSGAPHVAGPVGRCRRSADGDRQPAHSRYAVPSGSRLACHTRLEGRG